MGSSDKGRAQAVVAMDSHEDIERLLPVTSWRYWFIALACLLLVVAAVLYAAATYKTVTVSGTGRASDLNGVRLVTATVAGEFDDYSVTAGDTVKDGQIIGYIITVDQRVPQRAQVDGTVLGLAMRPGDPVNVGDWLTTISASSSDGKLVLATYSMADGDRLASGQKVSVTVEASLAQGIGGTGTVVTGVVTELAREMDAKDVYVGLALPEQPDGDQTIAVIALDQPVSPGSIVRADVIVSERNLLQQVLGRS
ncbi:MAG: HlyD family efflux transporter periplasmic adaptor subunit [Candidatus Nanopelagicales bacterium]|nr:HlyD family efflux transporter periplasmic adaptor subunit [Candidatus Nanopelagicales bacterium]